uniref:Uncharacterized protein n=1 Tax=Pectobacterium carotovorum TaxID=554 RepID=A0A0K0MPW9_PECCA|nr:hypothetical protein [Pectobacterium carotovorum]AKG47487.1 hypothetical protein pA_00047 [Pectobacterium carotovorum]
MDSGLQVYDAGGKSLLSVTDKIGRICGQKLINNLSAGKKITYTYSFPELSGQGTLFYWVGGGFGNSYTDYKVTISGTTLTLVIQAGGYPFTSAKPFILYYGVM